MGVTMMLLSEKAALPVGGVAGPVYLYVQAAELLKGRLHTARKICMD